MKSDFPKFLSAFWMIFLILTVSQAQTTQPQPPIQLELAQTADSGLVFTAVPAVWENSCLARGVCEGTDAAFDAQYLRFEDEAFAAFVLPKALVERARTRILKLTFSPNAASADLPAKKPSEISSKNQSKVSAEPVVMPPRNVLDLTSLPIQWEDRLFSPETGSWLLSMDRNPKTELLADGPVCSVTRQTLHFARRDGSVPPSEPTAVFDWFRFQPQGQKNAENEALIFVRVTVTQKSTAAWKELHLGELHLKDGSFTQWVGMNSGSGPQSCLSGNLNEKPDEKVRIPFTQAAGLTDGKTLLSVHAPDVLFYGDATGKRVYLLPHSVQSWKSFDGLKSETRSFLLKVRKIPEGETPESLLTVGQTALLPKFCRWSTTWETRPKAEGEAWTIENADLKAELSRTANPDGSQSLTLCAAADARTGFLFSQTPQELFSLVVEQTETRSSSRLTSRSSWRSITREVTPDGEVLTFADPIEFPAAPNLKVRVTLNPAEKINAGPETSRIPAFGFHLSVATGTPDVRPMTASVGALLVSNSGPSMMGLHPGGCGTLVPAPASSGTSISAAYPSLGAVMPWLAVWDPERQTGLYFANLDASGAAKTIRMMNSAESGRALLEVSQPLPLDPQNYGAEVEFAGTLVWQRLTGDWYDASVRYRDWVRRNANWFPKMGPEGRASTPLWMKKLCVWGRVFGYAKDAVPAALQFRETLGIPVGIHWYQWHQIPFDDDYPHYLPPKEGFKEGVAEMQAHGCRVVPYTNGRLWDTRDRGTEDFEFTAKALAGATKKPDGTPFTESYRSREKDGSKVVLAAMCPASEIWKETVAETNRALICDYGLDGAYMDQIACCGPVLCEDPTHGHPLRGGSWWSCEYRSLLAGARQKIASEGKSFQPSENQTQSRSRTFDVDAPKDFIFSSESNAETCANDLDGMVCWHVEGKNVPAYCVTYAGVVFPYGRAYDSNTRAMRMKWANNLANGDQPGWFPPQFAENPEQGPYLRPLVRFRYHSISYFYLGELNRPPRLTGKNLPVWSENWNVFGRFSINTMLTVQTAARRILDYDYDADGNRLWDSGKVRSALLVFTNYSYEDVTSPLEVDWRDLGIQPETARFFRVDSEGRKTSLTLRELRAPIRFPAGETWGIEIIP